MILNLSERDDVICDMAALGLSLRQIGDQFGISGERVRQILVMRGVRTSGIRSQIKEEKRKSIRWPIPGFRPRMYRWLRESGFQRCCYCQWQPSSEFCNPQVNVCRKCNRAKANIRYHTSEHHREYVQKYRNSEAGKAVIKKAQRKYLDKQLSTDEGRERLRRMYRENWQRWKGKHQGLKGPVEE